MNFLQKYLKRKSEIAKYEWHQAKKSGGQYLFLAPFGILFITFYVLPVITSLFLSFTYFNILQAPKFIGLQNYINLLLADDVFIIAVKNTIL